jgi:hypothetical protein
MSQFPRRQRSQGYVEFGLTIAVVALVAMIGLDSMKIAVYAYFTGDGMSQSLNPTPPVGGGGGGGGGPSPDSLTSISCPQTPPPLPLDQPVLCSATVTRADTGAPLSGYVQLTVNYAGYGGVGQINTNMGNGASVPCQLDNSGTCIFAYTPFWSGTPLKIIPYTLSTHNITADYSQSGYVASQATSAPMSIRRRTAVAYSADHSADPTCTSPVRVGQPTVCTVSVTDIDTGRGRIPHGDLTWSLQSPANGGTFSPSATCPLDTNASCSITYWPSVSGQHDFQINYAPTGDNFHNESGLWNGPWSLQVK